jgi:amino acid adenylation domain-containing protein
MMLGALTKEQQKQLLAQNQTNTDFPLDQCIHQLFEKQVERTPDAIAVVFEQSQLTYRELNSRANQLAYHLISLGVKPETLVGICVERSLEMIIGLLGILKAGGAYVPLDPSYPQKRLAFMLKDSQVPVLLTQKKLLAKITEKKADVICLDTNKDIFSKESVENPNSGVGPQNLAYVIYTSGTTGKPKGVEIQQKSLVNLVSWHQHTYNVTVSDRATQIAGLSFDASVWEIWPYLTAGASVYMPNANVRLSSSMLLEWLANNSITISFLTTSLAEAVLEQEFPSNLALRALLVGGDKLNRIPNKELPFKLFNNYGPTENTVVSTYTEITEVTKIPPPIGRPITNSQVYVLDEQMEQVQIGTDGELYVGGIGLARGYLNRPGLTSEKFVPNPFSDDPNSRLYKTGDLVRYLPDGNLKFLGRIDHQVKIRGFRIELGEIEAKLHQYPDLSDAVVIAREDVPGDKRLVAYIIPSQLPRQRVPLHSEGKIKCLIADDKMRPSKEVNTFDISYGGVGLLGMPTTDCRQGKRLSVHLRLPDMSDELCVEGNIAWQQGDRAGIQFDSTSDETIQLHNHLNEFLEKKGVLKILQNTFIEHLRHFLQESLPDYMVPSHFVILDALPLTPNGKLDRNALPAPDAHRPNLLTAVEKKLSQIWAEVLGLKQVELHDNFLQLGGHSLLATQIVSHINEEFSVDLPLYCLFEAPTVAKLAEQVEDALKSSCPLTQAIEHADRNINIPLSFGQQQLWLFGQFVPNIPVYNEPATIRLGGFIDVIVLEQSLNEICRRHEILRTTFTTVNGEPVQVISPFVPFTLPIVDLREFPESEREIECLRFSTEEAVQPFDLEKGPLFRATLMRLSEEDYRLCWTAHHIIFDGVSLYNILFPELATLYKAFAAGQASPLPTPTFQYADYANWQRQRLQGEGLEKQLVYWKQQLADLPTLQLPTDHPRPAVQTYRGARYCLALPKELTESLKKLSQQEGVTLFMTLLAAFKTLLHRYSGQDDIPVGTVTSSRNHAELENIFGFFLNTLVLRTDLSDNPSAKQLLQKVGEVTLNAYANEDLPFELLVKELHPERQISANPLFQVAFVLEPQAPEIELGWMLSQLDIHPGTAKFDLTMELDERPEGIIGRIEYNTDLFDEATIIRMVGHYQTLLEGIVANPEQSISQLPLLTANEQQQFLDWNKSPLELCVHELFEAQVERSPDAVAVVFEDQQLTYRELNNRANQLAHYLKKLGVKQETLVGVCVERSLEMMVGILGILKAGGAYVPLDPTYPPDRLSFMLEDAQVRVLLTQQHLQKILGRQKHQFSLLCLDSDWTKIATESEANPINLATPNTLAYVIYTSGSTGKPKGVAIEHRNTVALLNWAKETFTPTQIAGVLASTSICFDLSVFELFVPLSWGGQVILVENALHLPTLSSDLNVTLVNTVPSAMTELVRINGVPDSVRVVNLAGEPLQNTLVQQIYQQETIEHVFNLYGPSEDTTYSTFALVKKGATDSPSIGRPITNTQVHILDCHFQSVPVGVVGELYIGGAGLARGYLNCPELTAKKFIQNPFSDDPKARLYKTGDLVRYLSDGNIEFLGRIDHQVKIRGFRIELGEIEAVLTQHPQIREIVVMAREDIPGDKRLVAYFVAKQQYVPSTTELRQFLADKLPDYMIPSAFVALETLPLTPNGKVNRKALPKPQEIQREVATSLVAPQTELEQTIAKIWQEVLHIENVGIQETFFELGGHSLLVVQMQEKLVKALNQKIPVTVLFQYPTIQGLAQYLSQSLNRQPTMATPKVRSARAAKKQAAIAQRKKHHEKRQIKLAA